MAKKLYIAFIVVIALALGYTLGKTQAIHNAELIGVDDYEYHISFGDEIHTYTFE